VNLTECEICSVLFGPHGRVEEWNLTARAVVTPEAKVINILVQDTPPRPSSKF
jgi:hypothetical protein